MTPDTIPPERLERFGVGPRKLVQYAGLKEEYYLADFAPDAGELERLGVDRGRVVVIVRPPPEVTLYHRLSNDLFPQVLERLGRDPGVHAVVIPRTVEQRAQFVAAALPSLIVPADAVDAQSLIALADLVVSAGGTMNREAVALGTPVYSTFAGRLGGVDEHLLRAGRLRMLVAADEIELVKQHGEREVAPPRPRRARRPHPRSRRLRHAHRRRQARIVRRRRGRPASCAPACSSASATRSPRCTATGVDVVIVTSGAIARGMRLLELPIRPRAIEDLQAASAVGQGKLYRVYDELLRDRGLTSPRRCC